VCNDTPRKELSVYFIFSEYLVIFQMQAEFEHSKLPGNCIVMAHLQMMYVYEIITSQDVYRHKITFCCALAVMPHFQRN